MSNLRILRPRTIVEPDDPYAQIIGQVVHIEIRSGSKIIGMIESVTGNFIHLDTGTVRLDDVSMMTKWTGPYGK